jgi:uncharacterized ferritin-like protein (DUF455 family)
MTVDRTPPNLHDEAVAILQTPDASEKAALSRCLAKKWRDGTIVALGCARAPNRPARPSAPVLSAPRDVPRRRINKNVVGRTALLHALAHIELNAIDLAWDILVRFAVSGALAPKLVRDFADDWVLVADEEAKHFLLLNERLNELGSYYGALNAHDGLWEAAAKTAHDLCARLAIVPLVLEARGLDVTPPMIEKLNKAEDIESAAILDVIHRDEITHVAIGHKWFEWVCLHNGQDPAQYFQTLVRQYYKGSLKAPFNRTSRDLAGFPANYYEPLAVS